MDAYLAPIAESPAMRALVTLSIAVLVAAVFDLVGGRVLLRLARSTKGDLDDAVVHILRRPIAVAVLLLGTWYALSGLGLSERSHYVIDGLLVSIGAIYWTVATLRLGNVVLDTLARRENGMVRPQTRPMFDLLARIVLIGGGIYFLLLAWQVDVTAWFASAGIVGIAVGFASQQTLANLFAGLSILMDQPYRIGDFLVIDDVVRGRVTDIGMRSTRLITRDDVEVIIPNSQMASARIVNESGGPNERERVTASVGVDYGSDIDHVRQVLLACASDCGNIVRDDPIVAPRVRFREFGDSSLIVHLLVWIPKPELRGQVLDELNTLILKRFRKEGINIPFPIRTVMMPQREQKAIAEEV